ncbi:MAG: nucleotidyltransferase family protein, partial [Eubacteriales bacterium]
MQKVVGIVSEYNPFHRGHLKQIHWIRGKFGEDCQIVAIMSGDFVQRGQPAIYDKWVRSRVAVDCGVNLVVELPITKALSSAEGFAQGAVEALDKLGMVTHLCFG